MNLILKTTSKTILVFSMLALLLILNSCKKDNDPISNNPQSTSLELLLKDNLGNNLPGTSVRLYASEVDLLNGTNQVGPTKISNTNGLVVFENLSNIKYYWLAEKGCLNNMNGAVTTLFPLTLNIKNTANSILNGTGTLKFVSSSSNPYRIYINGTPVFDMNGGTTSYRYYMPTGFYSIRVLQLSGYILYPTDKTFTGNLGCGQTMTTNFP